MSDPATDPHHDLARYPQDPQARQPGERLTAWLARRCEGTDAPPQPGDPGSGQGGVGPADQPHRPDQPPQGERHGQHDE